MVSLGGITQFLTLVIQKVFNFQLKVFDITSAPELDVESLAKANGLVQESYDEDSGIIGGSSPNSFWKAIAKVIGLPEIPEPQLDEATTINIAQFIKPKKVLGIRLQKTGSPFPILYHGRDGKTEKPERPASKRDGKNNGTGS